MNKSIITYSGKENKINQRKNSAGTNSRQSMFNLKENKGLQESADFHKEGCEHQGHDRHEFDQDIQGRTGGVLKRIADRVTHNRGLMRGRTLAAVMAFFDVFLRIVPGTAGVGHEDCQQNAGDERACEQTAERFRPKQKPDQQRNQNSHDARNNHLVKSCGGGNADAGGVIGLRGPFKDAGNLTELAANLFNHLVRRLGDGIHRHGGEGKGKHTADQKSDDHVGGKYVDTCGFEADLVRIGDKQGESGERRGPDGKALAHCGRRIADCVELIRNLTYMGIQTAHLGDTAGVVSDGTVGVNRDGDSGGGQHADRSQRNAVQVVRDTIGDIDSDADPVSD